MKLSWTRFVGEPFSPFNEWLKDNYQVDRHNRLDIPDKLLSIKEYLLDQGLKDIQISDWNQTETIIKFKSKFTGKYWHQSTWNGLVQRGRKGNCLDSSQTLIIEPLIRDVMNSRGTPLLKIEKRYGDYDVYFYSARFN